MRPSNTMEFKIAKRRGICGFYGCLKIFMLFSEMSVVLIVLTKVLLLSVGT